MTIRKRLTFKCWKCDQPYSLLRDIDEGNPVLSVACPFCGAEATADLNPHRKQPDSIYKGGKATPGNSDLPGFDLPDVLPTRPR